ncbi:DNA repair protein UVH3 [Impatiens glandulifera]|uniref:DNA repair protein UVH3 n=1 Tax=Impatiens glandulifera TaxID=253017 RepID=UPI001FB06660|nr:DNA repair protein UVH3 [Impatiens glandulifera]
MGVHGLWELLAPVGRRVSVETLAGKKLAIDASIWMVQFMKAMRDDRGEMVRNAHLLGFFRRICKLLFLRTKPVFVFDGGTPALKRRTVIARRRQRENAQAKIRKTAEKLLLNHLKAMRLKELANELENQRKMNDNKGKKILTSQVNTSDDNEGRKHNKKQEALDEMLAASLAAEEDGGFPTNPSTSGGDFSVEEEEEDEDEEMIVPTINGDVDPAILAALPPSMQLDLLVQMRERLMAENRQKYQKVKQAPAKFSELQIQSYLKTVAFRREIHEVQKSASGKVLGDGVQTSRIASEANREFIFSSSFTGDKQALVSAGIERSNNELPRIPTEPPVSKSVSSVASTSMSGATNGATMNNSSTEFNKDVETYVDERGRTRFSRVRAMGIRMTRDLQRNLDLMKEIEQDRNCTDTIATSNKLGNIIDLDNPELNETSDNASNRPPSFGEKNYPFIFKNEKSIEISFEDDGESKTLNDDDDDLFAQLVAGGDHAVNKSTEINPEKNSYDPDSDFDWEEGPVAVKNDFLGHDQQSFEKCDTGDVEWEEGNSAVPNSISLHPSALGETSKGTLEEEADIEEAIRRSLQELKCQKSADSEFSKLEEDGEMGNKVVSLESSPVRGDRTKSNSPLEDVHTPKKSPDCLLIGIGRIDNQHAINNLNDNAADLSVRSSNGCDEVQNLNVPFSHKEPKEMMKEKIVPSNGEKIVISSTLHAINNLNDNADDLSVRSSNGCDEVQHLNVSFSLKEPKEMMKENTVPSSGEKIVISSNIQGQMHAKVNSSNMLGPENTNPISGDMSDSILDGASKLDFEVTAHSSFSKTAEREEPPIQNSSDLDSLWEQPIDTDAMNSIETAEALKEEIQNLDQERADLGNEQRRLERNAESVSSEMFAECQELLQMFGLPYIIAPMEAEAQCAFLELANLVDGVVTDDSDAFLFGASHVYKNIFDERKYVETYFMEDIDSELGLSREKLIRIALLLGSDYTEGVSGIGIVNAIEVINAFPEDDGFSKFREWIESPDPAILGKLDVKTGSVTPRKGSNSGTKNTDVKTGSVTPRKGSNSGTKNTDDIQSVKQIFMDKHRNVSKNWHIPSTFPSEAVIAAYAYPQVDKSTESFSWRKPDLSILRKLCSEKFGWNYQKADELLLPVFKEYNKHETQLRMEAFYSFNEKFAKIRSKRIKNAVKGIVGKPVQHSEKGKKRKAKQSETMEDGSTAEQQHSKETIPAVSSLEEARNCEPMSKTEGKNRPNKRQNVAKKRRKKKDLSSESNPDDRYDNESQSGAVAAPFELRKSTRTRKAVSYNPDIMEIDDELSKADEVCEGSKAKEDDDQLGQMAEPSDYLKMGGGFCSDKEEDEVNKVRKEDADLFEADYLKMGGGFCSDKEEDEVNKVPKEDDDLFEAELGQSSDYLKMGGGFCSDKEEDEVNKVPKEDDLFETELGQSSDYLGMGGGFCLDKEEDEVSKVPPVQPETESISNQIEDAALSGNKDLEEDYDQQEVRLSLRAMPNLRRKRRKT